MRKHWPSLTNSFYSEGNWSSKAAVTHQSSRQHNLHEETNAELPSLVAFLSFSILSSVLSQRVSPPNHDWGWVGSSRWPFPLSTHGPLAVAVMKHYFPKWWVWPVVRCHNDETEARWAMHGEKMTMCEGRQRVIEHCSPLGWHLTVSPGKVPWPSAPDRKTPFLTGQPKWFFKIASLEIALILKSV